MNTKLQDPPTCASVLKKVNALRTLGQTTIIVGFELRGELYVDDEHAYIPEEYGATILLDFQKEKGLLEILPRIDQHLNSVLAELKAKLLNDIAKIDELLEQAQTAKMTSP